MNTTTFIPQAGDTGEEEKRIHIEIEPVRAPREVPAEPVPA